MGHRSKTGVGGEFGGRAERSEITTGDRDELGSASGADAGYGFENPSVAVSPEHLGDLFVQLGDLTSECYQGGGCLLHQQSCGRFTRQSDGLRGRGGTCLADHLRNGGPANTMTA